MRHGLVCVIGLLVACATSARADEKEHEAAVLHLKKMRVQVEHQYPLWRVWLDPRKGEEDRKPLRVWLNDSLKLRQGQGTWFNDGWHPKKEDVDVLPKLRDLYGITIQAEGVNNDWLVVLQKLPRFKELVLHGRDFTDECMPHLRGLKELESLSLTSTRITEKGLDELKDLKNLGFLSLVGTEGITDTGFTRLPLKKIRFLNLDGTKVTDAGIAALKDSSDMEWLKLSGRTKQAGLQHLVGMKKLKRLQLEGAHATVTEMKAILAAAPKLKVIETGYAKGDYTRDGWNLGSRNEN